MPFTKLEEAIAFSAKAHEGQSRKASDVPYISHPFSVGMLLLKEGCREAVVIAGVLHDTLEDTSVTETMIYDQFGEEVLELVKEASEPDKSLSWRERKQHTIDHLASASVEACYVMAADKLHNLRSMATDYEKLGEQMWDRFNKGKQHQAWYYDELLKGLEAKLGQSALVKAIQTEFNGLF